MATFTNIGGAEPSTVTFRVASVQIQRGSTNEQQEIICIGDPNSSGAICAVSSAAPATNDLGMVVREAGSSNPAVYLPVRLTNGTAFTQVDLPSIQSTTVTLNSSASSALYALASSVASQRHKVFAYLVTSTANAATKLTFQSSNASAVKWHVGFGSQSSGVTGANLAVSPPAWIFATAAGEALNATISSTGVNVDVSISWFTEA